MDADPGFDPMPSRGFVAHAYGSLIIHHMNAAREKNETLRARIFDAISVVEELYPAETKAWTDMHAPKKREA